MLKELLLSLPSNLISKFNYLKQDYLGLSLDINVFFTVFIGFLTAFSLLAISYLIGNKTRKTFIKNKQINDVYLIDIAIGYILISTGIGILGFFSLLNPFAISAYLSSVILIALYPFDNIKTLPNKFYVFVKRVISQASLNKFVFIWLLLFIFLAITNLINPEIREDQYHIDLPTQYLRAQTTMIVPKEQMRVSGSPLLAEMYYSIPLFLSLKEATRFIHFGFYLLTILTLIAFSRIQEYKFSIYTPLLFVSAPVVIHETSSMYVDYQWIFCFLLSIFIVLNNKINNSSIIISGFLLGGMLATKLWTIVFIPVSVIYLLFFLKNKAFKKKLKYLSLFILFTLLTPMLWFLRALILTGNPLYPAFIHETTLENVQWNLSIFHYVGINNTLLNPTSLINIFSPLFFFGSLFFMYELKKNIKIVKLNLFKYLFFLLILYISIEYVWGRYLLGLYVLLIFFASIGIEKSLKKIKSVEYLLNIILMLIFGYYMLNAILILPYSLGWTDKNKYLTRVLSKNASYYDFNKQFDKHISKKDLVATYGGFGYYYANFNYVDIYFIFDKNNKSFDLLKKNGITKLFIKNGDVNYFCKKIYLINCHKSKYSYISSYAGTQSYYLYDIK